MSVGSVLALLLLVVCVCSIIFAQHSSRLSDAPAKPESPSSRRLAQGQIPDPKTAQEFVAWWLAKAFDASRISDGNCHREALNWMIPGNVEPFAKIFWCRPFHSDDSRLEFRPAKIESFACNGDGVVVRVLGVLFAIDSKNQVRNYLAFSSDFTVRVEELNYRIAGFTLTQDSQQRISDFLSADHNAKKSEFGDATEDKLSAIVGCCLGEEQYRWGCLSAAEKTLEDAQKACPRFARAFGMRGMILSELGRLHSGTRDCNRAIEIEPHNPVHYVFRALAKGAGGDHLGAIADNQRALELNPKYATPLNNIGIQHAKLGNLSKAIECFTDAISLNGTDPLYYFNRGEANEQLGLVSEAISDFSYAIWFNRDYLAALKHRCALLREIRNLRCAYADACEVIRLSSLVPDSYDQRGWVLDLMGEHKKAREDFSYAILLQPDCVAAYADRAYSYLRTGEPAKALPDAVKLLSLRPDRGSPHIVYGVVLTKLNRFEEAISEYRTGMPMLPDSAICHTNLAEALEKSGQLKEALLSLDRALKLSPDDGLALYQRAALLSKLNRHKEAVADFNGVIKQQSGFSQLYFERAKSRLLTGDVGAVADCSQGAVIWLRHRLRVRGNSGK